MRMTPSKPNKPYGSDTCGGLLVAVFPSCSASLPFLWSWATLLRPCAHCEDAKVSPFVPMCFDDPIYYNDEYLEHFSRRYLPFIGGGRLDERPLASVNSLPQGSCLGFI